MRSLKSVILKSLFIFLSIHHFRQAIRRAQKEETARGAAGSKAGQLASKLGAIRSAQRETNARVSQAEGSTDSRRAAAGLGWLSTFVLFCLRNADCVARRRRRGWVSPANTRALRCGLGVSSSSPVPGLPFFQRIFLENELCAPSAGDGDST